MKKIYINPTVIVIETKPVLLQSASLDPSKDAPEVTPDPDENIGGGFGSRRYRDDWDEEEDW